MNEPGVSEARAAYLMRRRRRARNIRIVQVGILAGFLAVWEIAARTGLVDDFIVSSPSRICSTLSGMIADGLAYHVGVTLFETLAGFSLGAGIGLAVAAALWWSDFASRVAQPYLVVLNSLPKIALGPVIIIWFGTGSTAIVFMTVLVGIIVAVMNMLGGFLATDKNKITLLRSMGASKLQILTKLVIPSALPDFIGMLKICVGMAWIGSIMGEYIVSKAGLGYLIVYGGQVFKLDLVMAATFILCILAAGMYFLVVLAEKLVIKHPR